MKDPDNHISVSVRGVVVQVVKSTSIWKAVVIEERGFGINSISANMSLNLLGVERLHQAKGVDSVFGQERSSEIYGNGRDERLQELSNGDVNIQRGTLERQ